MRSFSNEFRVGLLAIGMLAVVAFGILRTDDRPGDGGETWRLFASFPSAEGVYVTTPVRIAGVTVGSVEHVELVDGRARMRLGLLGAVQIPSDSVARLRADGMLGDKSVVIVPGIAASHLRDGDDISAGDLPPDLDALSRQVGAIAEDVKAITGSVRAVTDDERTRAELMLTIENVRALSEELRAIAAQNGDDLAVIADNLREVSITLNRVVSATGESIDREMAAVAEATATLDRTLRNLESITARVDRGEGTVGRLLNDEATIDSVNATLDEVGSIVDDVSRLRTEVYYRGNWFFGSDPTSPLLDENPTAGSMRNVLGIRIQPREDHWYLAEFVGHPQGSISYEDHAFTDLGTGYREVVVKPTYRFSLQYARRFHDLVFRFGVKESSGGIGADWLLFRDRFQVSADLYDFVYGSYPLLDGTPNLQLTLRALPWRHVYVEGGLDNVIMGARYGYATGYVGGGLYFDEQDLKFVLPALPVGP